MKKTDVPLWMTILIIVVMLPVLSFPFMLSHCPEDGGIKTFVWIYPIYVIAAGFLSYQCYPQRKEITYILLVLMVLVHIFLWVLLNQPTQILSNQF